MQILTELAAPRKLPQKILSASKSSLKLVEDTRPRVSRHRLKTCATGPCMIYC